MLAARRPSAARDGIDNLKSHHFHENSDLPVPEDEVFAFISTSICSVWALELLLLLKRDAPKGRSEDELVRELRSSATAVSEALGRLHEAGLIVQDSQLHSYRPATPLLEDLTAEAERLYGLKPTAVIKTIVTKNKSLQAFADSFKLKE